MLNTVLKSWEIIDAIVRKNQIMQESSCPEKDNYPSKQEVKAARALLRKARTKAAEDEANKAKKLQQILGDHEAIIELVRLKMDEVGFPSKPEDFHAKASDIRFIMPKKKVDLFWVEFKKMLRNHLVLKELKKNKLEE